MATAHAVTLIKTRQPMKTYSSIRHTIALLAASLLLVTPSLISAQDANRQGGQGQGQGRRGGGGGAFANMSEEQRAAMQEVNQEVREQSRAVNEARTELNNAIYAEKMDEAKIRENPPRSPNLRRTWQSPEPKRLRRSAANSQASKLKPSRVCREADVAAVADGVKAVQTSLI